MFLRRRKKVIFLHIGKNAGSEIRRYLRELNKRQSVIEFIFEKRPHRVFLQDLPLDRAYMFSVRNPISRYVSGFYSRKFKGLPAHPKDWNEGEALAFKYFEHANELAEALFTETELGLQAFQAIKVLPHTGMNQVDWFLRNGYFLEIRPPFHIIRQEHFKLDMNSMMHKLEIEPFELNPDATRSNLLDYSSFPELSTLAKENLRRWYSQDFEFYRHCESWVERNMG